MWFIHNFQIIDRKAMPKFAANLTMLFNETEFLGRFERAAKAGFSAVEFLFPYPYPADTLAALLQKHKLELVLHNLPAGNWDAGERGIACLPDRVQEFKDSVALGIDYATKLGAPRMNCLAGKAPQGVPHEQLRATLVSNLRFAAQEFKKAGLDLLIEPINYFDIPGFFLNTTQQAVAILNDVGAENAFVQYDIYHAQRMEGELFATIERELRRIGHMQLADNPGRHEPGSGEINYKNLFAFLDRIGYQGWIGCEYKPARTTEEGLGWIQTL